MVIKQCFNPSFTLAKLAIIAAYSLRQRWNKLIIHFSAEGRLADEQVQKKEAVNHQAEKILNDYGNNILRLAYSYLHNISDAEDILQDTVIRFLQAAPFFENQSHEKAWLLRVASNLSKNKIDYNKIRAADELDENLVAENRTDLSFVWEAVKSLPQKYREVIHLFYYEGYPTTEISRILGKNDTTVRSDLRRGRTRLKEILKEAYDFE